MLDLFRWLRRVDHNAALRFGLRGFEKGLADGLVKGFLFLLETVCALASPACAFEPDIDGHIENDCEVGHGFAGRDFLEIGDKARVDFPRRALIGAGRIDETVADDEAPFFERRPDRLVEVIDPRSGEDNGFCIRPQRRYGAGQQKPAQTFGFGRSAGFAGRHGFDSARREFRQQALHLRGFARTLAAFEGDEPPFCRCALL